MGLYAAALLAVLVQAGGTETSIAVTRDGVRVEAYAPAVGDLTLETPFGRFATPLDPVVEVVDGQEQLDALAKLLDAGYLDRESLVRDLSTAGQLRALARAAAHLRSTQPGSLVPYEELEAWAARVDPVPADVRHDDRVAWLWERAQRGGFVDAVIAGERLVREVSAARTVSNDRQLGFVDIRDGLRSPRPWVRRAAARVCGRQGEGALLDQVLEPSLTDSDVGARDGAAWASAHIDPFAARQFWALNLLRNEGSVRVHAALNLGRHGGDQGARVLIHTLAAWDRRPPERFRYLGRETWVVKDHLRQATRHTDSDIFIPDRDRVVFDPEFEHIDLGSTLTVTQYGETLRVALVGALDLWSGAPTGRDAAAWLAWYAEHGATAAP